MPGTENAQVEISKTHFFWSRHFLCNFDWMLLIDFLLLTAEL